MCPCFCADRSLFPVVMGTSHQHHCEEWGRIRVVKFDSQGKAHSIVADYNASLFMLCSSDSRVRLGRAIPDFTQIMMKWMKVNLSR